jgi:hypothetical protein
MPALRFQLRFRCVCLGTLVAATLLSQGGCVRRRLTVHSNPPGALVYVDNQQIGTTPCSVDFVYYGTREIRLVMPGYETLSVNQPIPTPWYQVPPLDFISENLVPYKIRDNRTVAYNLHPQMMIPTEELIQRGQQLRQATLQQAAPPAPVIQGPGPSIIPPPAILPPGGATSGPVNTPPPSGTVVQPPAIVPPANAPYIPPAGPGVVLPAEPLQPASPPFRY